MLTERLYEAGLRGWQLHLASLASVWLCVGLWIRAKTIGEDERGNAERRALFVGLWPPMLWLMGDSIERQEVRRAKVRIRTGRARGSRVRLPGRDLPQAPASARSALRKLRLHAHPLSAKW